MYDISADYRPFVLFERVKSEEDVVASGYDVEN